MYALNVFKQQLSPGELFEYIIDEGGMNPTLVRMRAMLRLYANGIDVKTMDALVEKIMNVARRCASVVEAKIDYKRHYPH